MSESPKVAAPQELRSVLDRISKGGRVSQSDRKLFGDYISADASPPPVVEAETSAAFALEAQPAPDPGKYRESIAHYAAFYSQGERTIKRWKALGKKKDDPVPLDDPTQMPLWFPRHHKHRVPEILLQRAAEARGAATVETSPEAPETESPPTAPTYRPPSELPDGSGYEAELQRVREECRKASGILADAEKAGNVADIDAAQRQYDRALKRLREFERDAGKILREQGNLVELSAIEALLLPKHAAIRADLEASYTPDVHRSLQTSLPYVAGRKIWLDTIHRALRGLVENGFGDRRPNLTLEAA